jgi:hypothetical protein
LRDGRSLTRLRISASMIRRANELTLRRSAAASFSRAKA